MNHLQKNAASSVKSLIKSLNDSYFKVELDNGSCLSVRVIIDKVNRKAKLDFSGTSPQGDDNYQAPLAITKAVVL